MAERHQTMLFFLLLISREVINFVTYTIEGHLKTSLWIPFTQICMSQKPCLPNTKALLDWIKVR